MKKSSLAALLLVLVGCGPNVAPSPPAPKPQEPTFTSHVISSPMAGPAATASPPRAPIPVPPRERAFRSELRPDMREARQGPDRSRAIVVTEIAQLEALERAADAATIQGEAAADGDRSAILRRLATTYGELAQLAQAEGAATLAQRSREKAKEKELLLVRSYPDAPNMEDVYFALADELEREGHLPDSFVQYYELTHRYPRSRFAPAAYVAFAEEHFTFAEKYPDEWPRTIALYEKAVELSAPRNREYGYALYKLAWAKQKSGDHASAVATFQKVIAASAASPGDAELAKMADASRSDLSIL